MKSHPGNTKRITFSNWQNQNIDLAKLLWGNANVTKYICASGVFSEEEIKNRLENEIKNQKLHTMQYWPIFETATDELIGCCGLRPYKQNILEIGFHLRPDFWGKGFAKEAASAVIKYAFAELSADALFAGHNPNNQRSKKLLLDLGFVYTGDEFYQPTGLYHPSYILKKQ